MFAFVSDHVAIKCSIDFPCPTVQQAKYLIEGIIILAWMLLEQMIKIPFFLINQ